MCANRVVFPGSRVVRHPRGEGARCFGDGQAGGLSARTLSRFGAATVTLTLATAVVSTDTVTVSYTRPTSGSSNALEDAAGNEVASFADRTVTNNTAAQATLTARFENGPDQHNGSSVFTLDLAFSEAVFDGTESFDKNDVIKNALQVTGGSVAGRRRVSPGAYDRWLLRIGPSGNGDVTVRLPATVGSCNATGAICTPDDRPLSAPASETIQGPPGLSVADAALLREARSLQRLDLAGNRLRDIWVLGDLGKLVWLNVSGNPVADSSPLGRLTGVRWLLLDTGASRTDAVGLRHHRDEHQFGGASGTSLPVPAWPSR